MELRRLEDVDTIVDMFSSVMSQYFYATVLATICKILLRLY